MNEIHGHEVLEMMLASGKAYTREGLATDIVQRFGVEARFYTCSAAGMTAAELVEFLAARGKFVPQADGFQTAPELMCRHEH